MNTLTIRRLFVAAAAALLWTGTAPAAITFRQAVATCEHVAQRRADPTFETYVFVHFNGYERVRSFGTDAGHFLFDKCMNEQGHTLYDTAGLP